VPANTGQDLSTLYYTPIWTSCQAQNEQGFKPLKPFENRGKSGMI